VIVPQRHRFENHAPLHRQRKARLAAAVLEGAQLVANFWRTLRHDGLSSGRQSPKAYDRLQPKSNADADGMPLVRPISMAALLLGGSVMADSPGFAADPVYGAYLAAECVACHRADAVASIPPLQMRPYDDLVAALKEYRAGIRVNPAMQSVARALGDAEIESLATYFSDPP
jgi:cytochrome c